MRELKHAGIALVNSLSSYFSGDVAHIVRQGIELPDRVRPWPYGVGNGGNDVGLGVGYG